MALIVIKREPAAATKKENSLQDWNSFLHSLWLEKMAANPGLFLDAKGER
jgi:hypothetical protein